MTDTHDLKPLGQLVTRMARAARPAVERSTRAERAKRLDEAGAAQDEANPALLFQHSLFCQTSFPVNDPGRELTTWARKNGLVNLEITAGRVQDANNDFVSIGLPWGPKARLLTYFLNTQAKLNNCPVIDINGSFSAFVRRLGLDATGRNLKAVKEQFVRLMAATMRLGVIEAGRATMLQTQMIDFMISTTLETSPNRRIIWPDEVCLSQRYWESLKTHAVPLNEKSLAALKHSSLALDLYCYLAHRLYRVAPGSSYTVYWPALAEQFGSGYNRVRAFRDDLRIALEQVRKVYKAARVDLTPEGLVLRESPEPVSERLVLVS